MTDLQQHGTSPRLAAGFRDIVNEIGGRTDSAADFSRALKAAGSAETRESLLAVLGALVGAEAAPGHVGDYLAEFPQYVPTFFGVMRSVAADAQLKFSLEIPSEGTTDLTLHTQDGVLTLAVLSTDAARA